MGMRISLYNYDKLTYAFDRANRCSAILSVLPPSPALTQLHAAVIDILGILKSCKSDAEALIRHLCYSFSGSDLGAFNPYECNIKDVLGGKRNDWQAIDRVQLLLNQQLDAQPSESSSFENTLYNNDSPQFPPVFDDPDPVSSFAAQTDFNSMFADPWNSSVMNDSTDDLWSSDYWGTPERPPETAVDIALPPPLLIPEKGPISLPPVQSPTNAFAQSLQPPSLQQSQSQQSQQLPQTQLHVVPRGEGKRGVPPHRRLVKEDEEYKEEASGEEETGRRKRGRPVRRRRTNDA